MPISIKKQAYNQFFEDSIAAFEQQIEELVPIQRDPLKDKRVFRLVNENGLANLIKSTGSSKGRFPFITTKLISVAPNTEGYNSKELKRKGIQIPIPRQANSDLIHLSLHPEPVIVTLQVNFISQNNNEVINFTKRWFDSLSNNYFDYELKVFDYPFKIHVQGDPTISFPDLESEDDRGSLYNVETSGVEIHTYIMTEQRIPAIKRFNLTAYQIDRDLKKVDTLINHTREEGDEDKE